MRKYRFTPTIYFYLLVLVVLMVFSAVLPVITRKPYDLESLQHYTKAFPSRSVGVCGDSQDKTYEDYRKITDRTSDQYKLIRSAMTIDHKTGILYDKDGFIGVALGYQFGAIGTRYYFELDSGIILPVIKIDAKDPRDASNGCTVDINDSVLEFVIDSKKAARYFGTASNNLVLQGNFNHSEYFRGKILDIELVQEE
ncbi:MAG: hypothetical protein IJJ44_10040 [Solobacterium sp.]|nr:hypothetical protein [Solobacterium sp.]